MICVFNDDGSMNGECGQFSGLMRFECRRLMLEKMKEIGCYRDTKPNPGQKLPLSQRTGDIIEPMLKPQWWVASKEMATKAADAVCPPLPPRPFPCTLDRRQRGCPAVVYLMLAVMSRV
jgi:valyl-tRNA synthetase